MKTKKTIKSPPAGHRVDALVGRLIGLIDRFEKATDEIAKADNQRLIVMKELRNVLEELR